MVPLPLTPRGSGTRGPANPSHRCEYFELSPPRRAKSATAPATEALTLGQLRALQAMLASPAAVRAHAELWFRAFAAAGGWSPGGEVGLDFAGLRAALRRLHRAVGVPWASDGDVQAALCRFGTNGGAILTLSGFHELFFRMLLGCRKKFQQQPVHLRYFGERAGEGLPGRCRLLKEGAEGENAALVQDNMSRKRYIMRTLSKNKIAASPHRFESRLEALRDLKAVHVRHLVDWGEDYWNVYLMLEACAASPLPVVLAEGLSAAWYLSEPWLALLARQVLGALAYCHDQQIVHGDLAGSSVLLRSSPDPLVRPRALLSEVGLREVLREEETLAKSRRRLGPKEDVLQFGAVLSLLLTGGDDRGGADLFLPAAVRRHVEEPSRNMQCSGAGCSSAALAFANLLLEPDEELRPEAREALLQPWCAGRGAAATDAHCGPLRARGGRVAALLGRARLEAGLARRVAKQLRARAPEVLPAGGGLADRLRSLGLEKDVAREVAEQLAEGGCGQERFVETCTSLFNDRVEQAVWRRLRGSASPDGAADAQEVARALLSGELAELGHVAGGGGEVRALLESLDSAGKGTVLLEDLCSCLVLQSDPCRHAEPLTTGGAPQRCGAAAGHVGARRGICSWRVAQAWA